MRVWAWSGIIYVKLRVECLEYRTGFINTSYLLVASGGSHLSSDVLVGVWVALGPRQLMFPSNCQVLPRSHVRTQNQGRKQAAARNALVLCSRLLFQWGVKCQVNVFFLPLDLSKIMSLWPQGKGPGSPDSLAVCTLRCDLQEGI